MKLYWTPASPFVRKVMVVAIELGLDHRIEILPTYWPHNWGFQTVEMEPDFMAANPVARIPTLVTDDGVPIAESNLICDHLQSLNEAKALLPKPGKARWEALRILGIADGALEAMIARRAELLRNGVNQSNDFIDKLRTRIGRCLDSLDAEIGSFDGPISLPQIAAGIACSYMDFRYASDDWRNGRSRLAAWHAVFAKRPSMMKTEAAETPQYGSAS